jgi:hypothetical protein
MLSFVRDCHVGYLCVHFTDVDSRVRWAIDENWKEVGDYTFSGITKMVMEERGTHDPSNQLVVQQHLAELVVEAAANPARHWAIPCRAYALMLAYNTPCLLIEAERSTQTLLTVDAINASPAQADKLIDELEESLGFTAMRTWSDSGSQVGIAIPADHVSGVSIDDLALSLPREIAEALASQFAQPGFREQLSLALEQASSCSVIRL